MFFKQLKRETLSEGRCNKKRKVDAAEEVAVDDDLAVTPVDICSSALFAGIGDSAGESASTSVATEAATLFTAEFIPDKDAATCATVSATMTTPVTVPVFMVTSSPVMAQRQPEVSSSCGSMCRQKIKNLQRTKLHRPRRKIVELKQCSLNTPVSESNTGMASFYIFVGCWFSFTQKKRTTCYWLSTGLVCID